MVIVTAFRVLYASSREGRTEENAYRTLNDDASTYIDRTNWKIRISRIARHLHSISVMLLVRIS